MNGNKSLQKWKVTSTYTMTGNVITDIVHADTEGEAWDEANKLKNRRVEEVEPTDWDGKIRNPRINGGNGRNINTNEYNPD